VGDEDIYHRHHLWFPVALIFSWAFEITPEGIKLESDIEPNKSVARRTGERLSPSRSPWRSWPPACSCIQLLGRDRQERRSDSETTEG